MCPGFAGLHACLLSGTERTVLTVLFTGHTEYAYSIGFTMCKETHIRGGGEGQRGFMYMACAMVKITVGHWSISVQFS